MPDAPFFSGSRDLLPVFNALPGAYLLLSPELLIEAASDEYLAATLTTREQLVGRFVFDAFPDNPAATEAHATRNLRASLHQVLATGQAHQMAPQHYDVPDPTRPGGFVERHWLPTNRPVLDAQGRVMHLIHAVVDITDQRIADRILRESQAAEQAAYAEAERQRQRFYDVLMQLPAQIAVHEGPDQTFTLVNPGYQQLAGNRSLLGQPIREAWPELTDQGILDILDRVYQTGESFVGTEIPLQVDFTRTGALEQVYYNAFFLPLRDTQGRVTGVLDFSYNVTEQVLARQQVEHLNQALEARVQERTQAALALQADLLAAAQQQAAERQGFQAVFEQTPALIALLRAPGHRYEYVNPAYQALFPGRQLLGLDVAVAVPEMQQQEFVALLDEVYRSGETYVGREMPFDVARPGEKAPRRTYFNFTMQAYREAGTIAGISIFAFDATEQVRARQEREAQRQQLYHLFRQAPAAICILAGEELMFELVNPGYQALFPDRELAGRPLLEAVPEIADHAVYRILRQVYATGITHQELGTCVPLARVGDGQLEDRYFNYIQQPRHDAHGRVDGVLVFAFEVTQQVRAQQRAERSESRFRQLAEATPMIVWEADNQGHTTYLSPNWEQFTTAANGQGLGWQQYMHPDDQDSFLQAWLAAVAAGQPFAAEMRLRVAATGEYRWHLDRAVPVRDGAGQVVQWVGAAIDIHEQKLAEQRLQELANQLREARDEAQKINQELNVANQQLVRTNADLDTFIYTASHDLKSPITNIEGLLLALREQLAQFVNPDPQVAHLLQLMQGSVERFQRTIGHLSDITQLQHSQLQPAEQVSLADLVKDVRLDLAPELAAAAARLTVDVSACPHVSFAPQHLRSIVYNLLSNAVKYRHPDRPPHIRLRCRATAAATVLEVQDNGLGLNEDQQGQLFGLFRRLHSHVEGAGVGLYTVKKIVENAGGRVAVHSQPGQGTTFTVFLPPKEHTTQPG